MKLAYDNCHNIRQLPDIDRGDPIYIRELDKPGTVWENLPGRSHLVTTNADIVRRN